MTSPPDCTIIANAGFQEDHYAGGNRSFYPLPEEGVSVSIRMKEGVSDTPYTTANAVTSPDSRESKV